KSTEMTEEGEEDNDLRDVVALADHSYHCGSWPVVVTSQEDDWLSFEMELVENTKHAASAELVKRMFVPTVMKLAGGERLFGFVLATHAHLLAEEGKVVLVSPLKYRLEKTSEDTGLTLALKPHRYGQLAKVNEYELLEDGNEFWCMPFSGGSELVARKLQSCLIQSGPDVILCLKVEVYGRSLDEDPHGDANVALPDIRPFNIVNQKFDDASQLMIGTVRWNALLMMAVELTSGRIIVGPNNTTFNPHGKSRLWLKKGGEKDMRNNLVRQIWTNFDDEITYGNHAAVHPRFLRFNTKPVTLADLWSFKVATNGWSGLKLVAFIFNKLYGAGVVLRSDVQERLDLIRCDKGNGDDDGDNDHGIRNNLRRLIEVMGDKETRPVSVKVDRELRGLADKVQKELSKINRNVITREVQKTIEGMLLGLVE
ncbi:hypothetical protein BG000_004880, partial [Podila horticola]